MVFFQIKLQLISQKQELNPYKIHYERIALTYYATVFYINDPTSPS